MLDEELDHRARNHAIPDTNLDLRLRHRLGKSETFFLLHLRRCGLRLLADALVLVGDQSLEPLAHDDEDLDVVLKPIRELLENSLHAPKQRIRGIDIGGQARRKLPQRVEHLPGRMGFLGKERLVCDRDLEHRDLQPADEPLHADGYLGIIE